MLALTATGVLVLVGVGIGRIYPPPASLQHGRRTGGSPCL